MSVEEYRTRAEVAWIRIRSKLRVGLRAAGLLLVLLAIFNVFGPVVAEVAPVAPYRAPLTDLASLRSPLYADLIVLTIGLVVAWWG